jgi:hypothetical protein
MTEQHLTKAIITAVNATGLAFVWRSQAGRVKVRGGYMQLAPDGCPDVIGWMTRGASRAVFVGIEVKLPGEQPSPVQKEWHRWMRGYGCVVATAWSVADAIEVVKEAAA